MGSIRFSLFILNLLITDLFICHILYLFHTEFRLNRVESWSVHQVFIATYS
jgi:hypothetical protein